MLFEITYKRSDWRSTRIERYASNDDIDTTCAKAIERCSPDEFVLGIREVQDDDSLVASVGLEFHPRMDTILMGHVIGSWKKDDGEEGDLTASGRTIRVHIKGIDGYVDIDLQNAVEAAVAKLRDS